MAFESDSYYTDKLSGKEVHLEAVQDVSIVTFDPDAAGDVGQFIRERGLTELSFQMGPTLGFAIVKGDHGADVKSHPLAGQEQVLGWTYLFKDQEGGRHYILPRRLDVRFQPGISAKHALAVIEQVGGHVLANPRTPGFYSVTAPHAPAYFTPSP